MSIEVNSVKDPLISGSGEVYSARGIALLWAAIFPECVDKSALLCGDKSKGEDHVRGKEKSDKTRG